MKLLGVQSGGNNADPKGAKTPVGEPYGYPPTADGDPIPDDGIAKNSPVPNANTRPSEGAEAFTAYNPAADMLERHARIANKIKSAPRAPK